MCGLRTRPGVVLLAALLPALVLLAVGCNATGPARSPAASASRVAQRSQPDGMQPTRWYKGNLHTHSLWSDGDDFPEMIADWYRSRGYDFLALSDHNILSEGEKWMKWGEIRRRGGPAVLRKYEQRFPDMVRTRGNHAAGTLKVRLSPLAEVKRLLERPGEFLLVQSEEITDKFEQKPIHMNATNVAELIKPRGGRSVREVIANNLRAVREQAERTGRPILPHLNHPNFGWGVTAEDLAAVVDERFFEVYNGHPAVHHLGDDLHPGVERLWDIANTIRLARLGAPPLMGLATDDSHNYHVVGMNRSGPGRGWVMVRAAELTPEALIRSIEAGDFYASSGVTLKAVHYSPQSRTLELEIDPDEDAAFTTRFVGTPADVGDDLASNKVGMTFATAKGLRPRYQLTGKELYVRAVVTSSRPPESPSFQGQLRQAWTQPVGWVVRQPLPGRAGQ